MVPPDVAAVVAEVSARAVFGWVEAGRKHFTETAEGVAARLPQLVAARPARFKSNLQTIPFALNKVLQLRGVTFDYKDTQKHSIGFIAEEVGRVVPEVVEYEANGRDAKGLDYNRLTPVVVEAIKEQQQTIEKLQQENNKLKARNVDTEARLANVETTVKRMAQNNRRHRRLR
jgi:hypothetical protein